MKRFILAVMLALAVSPAFAQTATINPNLPSMGAWDGSEFQVFDPTTGAYSPSLTNAAVVAYTAAHPPPTPPAPPAPPAPTPPPAPTFFYVTKVNWVSRLTAGEFARLDAINVQVQSRPADWATNTTAPWPAYTAAGVMQGMILFQLSDDNPGINVMDPRTIALVNGFPALGVISYADYTQPTDGSTPLTPVQWSAQRIAAILAAS